jgi:hypothetical protein
MMAEIRASKMRKPITLSAGGRVRMFNAGVDEAGWRKAAGIRFERRNPLPWARVATVQIRSTKGMARNSRILSGEPSTFVNFDATVPPGFRLDTGFADDSAKGNSSLTRQRIAAQNPHMIPVVGNDAQYEAAWTIPGYGGIGNIAEYQWSEKLAKTPLQIEAGQPKEIFSYTNSAGTIYRAVLKLAEHGN